MPASVLLPALVGVLVAGLVVMILRGARPPRRTPSPPAPRDRAPR